MKNFFLALSTLSVLPVHVKLYDGGDAKKAAQFFPVVGALLGLLGAFLAYLLIENFSAMSASFFIAFIMLGVSRAFHMDGFADCADGFWSSRPKEKKLEIMKDSHIGVMGVCALIFLLIGKFVFLQRAILTSDISHGVKIVFFAMLAGRCGLNVHMFLLRPQGKGLGQIFWNRTSGIPAMICVVAFELLLFSSLYLSVALFVVSFIWSRYCRSQIDYGTGDTLGASCEFCELTVLFYFAEVNQFVV